jgi:carbon-monoxide dehydrogenase catalytic subunit
MDEPLASGKISTALDRAREIKPCPLGAGGTCCRVCAMGPCRVTETGKGARVGVCGATPDTIAARNLCRMIAAGTAAHSDHAREVVETFCAAARGTAPGFELRDREKLARLAAQLGCDQAGDPYALAREVGRLLLGEFGRQDGELAPAALAPTRRLERWRRLGVVPRGIDREVVETLHRTHMGVDQEAGHLLRQGTRTALADGWGGSMIACAVQDVLFGTPRPVRSRVDLGVLKPDFVNVVVHGHEPLLPEVLVRLAGDGEITARARAVGAAGVNIAGMCCTANELLMRHGVPVAGHFLQQELAILTGAVELMLVDVQCVMQGLAAVAACHHTRLVTTSVKARIKGARHVAFTPETALNAARELLYAAIDNFPHRRRVDIPPQAVELVAGFGPESIRHALGGRFRGSYRVLNENIISGRVRGVAAVVGCTNPRAASGANHGVLVRELLANDVLVLVTGCAALACAREGLLVPEAAAGAGPGLREVCAALGIPPVLHCGSCVDNSRILLMAAEMVREGGLGDDLSDLPVAGCAPEWVSEKALAIGQYFIGSGISVGLSVYFPGADSKEFAAEVFGGLAEDFGAAWFFEPDPELLARRILAHIDGKRRALGIKNRRERVLYDMEMRRRLDV